MVTFDVFQVPTDNVVAWKDEKYHWKLFYWLAVKSNYLIN